MTKREYWNFSMVVESENRKNVVHRHSDKHKWDELQATLITVIYILQSRWYRNLYKKKEREKIRLLG